MVVVIVVVIAAWMKCCGIDDVVASVWRLFEIR